MIEQTLIPDRICVANSLLMAYDYCPLLRIKLTNG